MTDINTMYEELIEPQNLIQHIEDFDQWLNLAECEEDLQCTLKEFEKAEMYEECVLILNKIKQFKQ